VSSKGETYGTFKSKFMFEKYLDTFPKKLQTLSNLELKTTVFQWRLVDGVALQKMKELVISVKLVRELTNIIICLNVSPLNIIKEIISV
jgi:hypothetical protein